MEWMDLEDAFPLSESDRKSKSVVLMLLLKEEERELKGAMGRLKIELGELNHELVSKDEQVGKLTRKVAKLKEDGEKKSTAEQQEVDLKVVEMKNPLEVFPEEIWRMILAHLSDWKDIKNCSRACPLFQTILKPLNPTILFDEAFPHLYRQLPGSEILNCRTVCKSWKAGVDNFLENHKSLRPHDDENSDPRYPPFVPPMVENGLGQVYTTSLGTVENNRFSGIRNRISILGKSSRPLRNYVSPAAPIARMLDDDSMLRNCNTPLVGRDTYCCLNRLGVRLLETCGTHISYLTVNFTNDGMELIKFVSNYLSCCLPNLRKLRLMGVTKSEWLSDDDEDDDVDDDEDDDEDENKQAAIPVQSLQVESTPKLETIQMSDDLVELHLKCCPSDISEWEKILGGELPNLKKLGLIHQTAPCGNEPPSSRFLDLVSHLSNTGHLATLRIAGRLLNNFIGTRQSPSYADAPSTLTTLEVEHSRNRRVIKIGKREMTDMTDYTFLLNLPFLENLNLFWRKQQQQRRWYNPPNLVTTTTTSDILLETKSENFEDPWYPHPYCRTEKEMEFDQQVEWEAVEVHKYVYQGDMYSSNIWEVLPKLKVLTFQTDVYTREGYDAFKKNQRKNRRSDNE